MSGDQGCYREGCETPMFGQRPGVTLGGALPLGTVPSTLLVVAFFTEHQDQSKRNLMEIKIATVHGYHLTFSLPNWGKLSNRK